jgi:hypothetical protein
MYECMNVCRVVCRVVPGINTAVLQYDVFKRIYTLRDTRISYIYYSNIYKIYINSMCTIYQMSSTIYITRRLGTSS